MNSIIFENEVKAELSAIVKASGVRNESQVATISKNVCELYNDMLAIYDDYSLDNATEFMDVIIAVTFDESYRSMENTKLSVKDKLIAAQKMTNVMMKSYSPAALDNAKFGHYANNYVVGNEKIFEERLGSLELSTDVMPDVRKAFGVKIEKAPSNNNALEEQKKTEEARLKAEQEEAQRKAEEEARIKAEREEAQRKAEEEARLKAEKEEAQRKAEEEAKKKAEEEENQRKALEEQKKLEKAKKANSAPSLEDYFEKPRVDKTKGSTYVGAYEAWYEERRRDTELTKLFEAKCKEIIGIPETEANSKMLDKVIGIARGTWYSFCENIDRANKFNQTDERHHEAQDNDMRNSFLYGMQKLADLKEDISTKEACIIMTKLTDLAAKLYAPEEDLPDDSYKKYTSCYMIDEDRLRGELWAFRNNGLNGEAYHKFIHEMAQELKEEFGMTKTSVSLPELSEAPKGATETSPKVEEIKANTKEKVVG
jgi:flagellar biosynthesis GTPase FlhF